MQNSLPFLPTSVHTIATLVQLTTKNWVDMKYWEHYQVAKGDKSRSVLTHRDSHPHLCLSLLNQVEVFSPVCLIEYPSPARHFGKSVFETTLALGPT